MIGHQDVVGKHFSFEYSSETYMIEVLSLTKVRWTRERGENVGVSDEEDYVFSVIDNSRFMMTWIEASGLGLSNVINMQDKTLITHANIGREVFVNPGHIRQDE